MKVKLDRAEMRLNRADIGLGNRETLRVSNGTGYTIACRSGQVWITQEGQLRDYILGPTESFVIHHPGDVLIQGYQDAKVRVTAPHRAVRDTTTIFENLRNAVTRFARHFGRSAARSRDAVFS